MYSHVIMKRIILIVENQVAKVASLGEFMIGLHMFV